MRVRPAGRRATPAIAFALLAVACQSSPSESPSEPGPSTSISEAPSDAPNESAVAEPGWEVTTFGAGPGPAIAREVAAFDGSFVAVGVEYAEQLPNLGFLPPHEGRIWRSEDGYAWEDVTPADELQNVDLDDLYVRKDGTLVANGVASKPNGFGGVEAIGRAAWQSSDGHTWASASDPILSAQVSVEVGERGYLALAYPGLDHSNPSLAFSPDGVDWDPVLDLPDGIFDLDAGDEGFVVVGDTRGPSDPEPVPYIVASADGQAWFPSSNPPPGIPFIGAVGGDWVLAAWEFSPTVPVWTSENGLDWSMSASVPLDEAVIDAQTTIQAFPAGLASSGTMVVLATTLAREGAFVIHGTEHFSPDGVTWDALPFPQPTLGIQNSGSLVNAAVDGDGFLLLLGQQNGQAAFWTGRPDQ